VHLTNYSLNKESDKFREAKHMHDDTGHKRTLTVLLERLKKDNKDVDKLMAEMKDVIIKTMLPI
jgi:tubulin polyglutamylase TTLL6/13